MSTTAQIALPSFGALSLARLSDLPRIGIISTASFYHSPVFHYLRPKYEQYLKDTIASYATSCQSGILDPDSVVIVAEQQYNKDETAYVFDELKDNYPALEDQVSPESVASGRVIVGTATFSLKADPARRG